jgi:hypothetical protein
MPPLSGVVKISVFFGVAVNRKGFVQVVRCAFKKQAIFYIFKDYVKSLFWEG